MNRPLRTSAPNPPMLAGALVKIPLPGRAGELDGFWHPGQRRQDTLLIYVHGMWSNFYRSALKWTSLRMAPEFGMDGLSFNNRGSGHATAAERFSHSLSDLESVRRWARKLGYRRMVWIGHSTGCQKAVHYLARRKPADAAALVLLAPADDLAIVRRDGGARYASLVRMARGLADGPDADRPDARLNGFSPRRFLSIALPESAEARLFDYDGRMTAFASLRLPILAAFGTREQYACRPVREMGEILGARCRSEDFEFHLVTGGDHSFHGREELTMRRVMEWIARHL
ncbi:MAG: alpha/beta fold hydrolase [Kiritimatiellae bacterium]|nr:alpha/beta fold hydrolase [Kiritimatiellia bacterium]